MSACEIVTSVIRGTPSVAPAAVEPGTASLPHLSRWVGLVAGVQILVLVATSTRYGYHGDEMYFIVSGAHPAFGYPDQPPLVPLICWVMNHVAPGSLLVLRSPSAVVAGVTTVLAAVVAREVGGRTRAQVIASVCAASSGFALAACHIVSTTTFDLLSTTALMWLTIRAVSRHSGRSLFAAGVVAGAGCEAKPQVAFVAAMVLVALFMVGPRWPLRSRWLAAGLVVAVILAAPYVIWQATHGWPQLTVAGNVAGSAEGGRVGFVPFQIVMVSPVLFPVWIAGLVAPFRRPEFRLVRFVPVAYALLGVAYIVGDGKAYYLASLYPTLLGLGALPVADWTMRHHARLRAGVLSAAVVVTVAVNAVVALPLLPTTALQGSVVMALNPDQGATVGWPQFVQTVGRAWRSIPRAERAHTVIFTGSYAEAAAVDLQGRGQGLPRSYSGHNAFSEWGQPASDVTHALLLGYDGPGDASPYFRDCSRLATINNGVGLDNDEQGTPVLLCRPAASWTALWPKLRHYN